MKFIVLSLAPVVFSSCMHVGMMGNGGDHHSSAGPETAGDPVLEKEIIVGDVRARALFPPIEVGSDVILTLKLMDTMTAAPISGAQVYLHVEYMHRPTPHDDHRESSSQREEGDHYFNIDQEVKESTTLGVYTIPYGSSQPGEHTLMFHITAIGSRALDPEITVEATRTISGESHKDQDGAMGGTNTTTYVIIGAAFMGAIMIAMIATHSGMF